MTNLVDAELVGGPFCGEVRQIETDKKGIPFPGMVVLRPHRAATYLNANYLTSAGIHAYLHESVIGTIGKEPTP